MAAGERMITFAALVAALLSTLPTSGQCAPTAPEPPQDVMVQPCPTEDTFTLCHWNGQERGNGVGRSFLSTAEGLTVYLDTLPACDTLQLPCLQPAGTDGAWPFILTAEHTYYLES